MARQDRGCFEGAGHTEYIVPFADGGAGFAHVRLRRRDWGDGRPARVRAARVYAHTRAYTHACAGTGGTGQGGRSADFGG